MYYEFYLDIFFIENVILDSVMLYVAGGILKSRRKPGKILLAASTGAAITCILLLSPLRKMPFLLIGTVVFTSFLMMKLAYGFREKRMLAKGMLCFAGTAFFTGGMFQMIASQISLPIVPLGMISMGILSLFLRWYQSVRFQLQNFYDVTLGLHGKAIRVRGLRDTGNHLREPVTGKPVSILSYDIAKELLDKDAKMFYIPYRSIGKSSGLLPGITLDYMKIAFEKGSQCLEHPVIAVSKEPVNRDGKYQIILHPILLDD